MSAYVEAMFSVIETPWHKIGTVLDNPPSTEEAIKLAGLDWMVTMADLSIEYPVDNATVRMDVENYRAICRLDESGKNVRRVLGVATKQYRPLQNREAFEFFEPLVEGGYVTLETAGSLKNGEVVWILAKLNDDIVVGKDIKGDDDVVKPYLLLHTAHNGKRSVKISLTPIRVVCWNTLSMTDHDTGISIPHRKNVVDRVYATSFDFAETLHQYEEIGKIYRMMAETPADGKDLDGFVETMFPLESDFSSRQINLIEKKRKIVAENFDSEVQTLWGLFNAFTGYIDYDARTRGGNDGKLNNIWFGLGAKQKTNAYNYIVHQMQYASSAGTNS